MYFIVYLPNTNKTIFFLHFFIVPLSSDYIHIHIANTIAAKLVSHFSHIYTNGFPFKIINKQVL